MRLNEFKAEKIYQFFNFNINFNKDLNLIIGANGTGKTTVLKTILALFSRDYIFISKLKFESIYLDFYSEKDEKLTDIYLNNFSMKDEIIQYTISSESLNVKYSVIIRNNKLFELKEFPGFEDERALLNLGIPMFLGLDRRFVFDNNYDKTIPAYLQDKYIIDEKDPLDNIISLVQSHALANRAKSFRASTNLRNKLIEILLEKNDNSFTEKTLVNIFEAPERFEKIRSSLDSLSLGKEIHSIINQRLLDYVSLSQEFKDICGKFDFDEKNTSSENLKHKETFQSVTEKLKSEIIDCQRLNKVLDLLENHQQRNNEIYLKINLFQNLVNNFFKDTDKEIFTDFEGILKVRTNNSRFETSILSSGERQLVILIGNLIFNKEMLKNRVFIIDEPELSLHISWQEMFVDTLLKGSQDIQFILATHSPAIVSNHELSLMTVNDSEITFFEEH